MANHGKYLIGIRLLHLKRFIETHAGLNRYVTRGEMEQYLADKGYPVEKKTIYSDLAVLDDQFNIKLEYNPHKKGYRLTNPQFDLSELRMLVDCVQFASFITEEEVATRIAFFGCRAKIIGPEEAIQEFENYHDDVADLYNYDIEPDYLHDIRPQQESFHKFMRGEK